MARQATPVELALVDETEEAAPAAQAPVATVEVVVPQPSTKSVRIKGTWTMTWGSSVWDFVDGQRYDIPWDLFEYLKSHGNVYDTM
jgi:hypothetical protein